METVLVYLKVIKSIKTNVRGIKNDILKVAPPGRNSNTKLQCQMGRVLHILYTNANY